MGVTKRHEPTPTEVDPSAPACGDDDSDEDVESLNSTINVPMVKEEEKKAGKGGSSSSKKTDRGSALPNRVRDGDEDKQDPKRSNLQLDINEVLGKTPPSPDQDNLVAKKKSLLIM
jgi:hypothetical protein